MLFAGRFGYIFVCFCSSIAIQSCFSLKNNANQPHRDFGLFSCSHQSISKLKSFITSAIIVGTAFASIPVKAEPDDIDLGVNPILPGKCLRKTSSTGVTTISCRRFGLDRDSRLLGCNPSENCVSTSAVNTPGKYSEPWSYVSKSNSARQAWIALLELAKYDTLGLGLKLVEADADNFYLHATSPSKIPPGSFDDLEFLFKPLDNIVLYRSSSRDALLVYPFQQPISDQNSNLNRLEKIRNELGWDILKVQNFEED